MKSSSLSVARLARGLFLGLTLLSATVPLQADDKKNDVAGTWSWMTPGRNGGPERKNTLKAKVEAEKLIGVVTAPNRDGQTTEIKIKDGKLKGDEISFTVIREFADLKMTTKYTGKVSGDAIKGKIEIERNGESQSRDWEAKREVEKPEAEKK